VRWSGPVAQPAVTRPEKIRASAAGMIGRGRNLPRSMTTCARWPSPKGTKCRPEAKFGYSINSYGIGDLVEYANAAGDEAVNKLCAEYDGQKFSGNVFHRSRLVQSGPLSGRFTDSLILPGLPYPPNRRRFKLAPFTLGVATATIAR